MTSAWRALALAVSILAAGGCNPSKGGVSGDATAAASVPSAPSTASATPAAASGKLRVVASSADTDALSAIRAARLAARAEGRVLVVYVGAGWCQPCRQFKAELASGRLDERLGKVTLLTFDADADNDRLAAAGYSVKFVPFVALPAADGGPSDTAHADGGSPDAWRQLLTKLDAWQRG